MIVNTALVLSILLGTAIPIVSGILTKAKLNESLRGLVTLSLAAATGWLTVWQFSPDPSHFNWQAALFTSTIAWVTALASHYGVLDKVVTGPEGVVQQHIGRHGLG